ALLPTISAAPSGDPVQVILGTPPGPRDNGEVFSRMHALAHEEIDPRMAWVEWGLSARLTPPTAPYGSAIILHLVGGCLSLRLRMSSLRSRVNCSLVSVWACGRLIRNCLLFRRPIGTLAWSMMPPMVRSGLLVWIWTRNVLLW